MSKSKKPWYKMAVDSVDGTRASLSIFDVIGWDVTAKDFRADLQALPESVEHIDMHIHSGGGDVLDGFAIYNAILAHPAHVRATIDFAASMASIIAMAADEVEIAENGWLMIHNPWTIAGGEAEDLRRMADVMDSMKVHAIKAYQRHVDADADAISAWMDAETWMTGDDFSGMGWDITVGDAVQVAASIQPRDYQVHEDARQWFASIEDAPAAEAEAEHEEAEEEDEIVDQVEDTPEDAPEASDEDSVVLALADNHSVTADDVRGIIAELDQVREQLRQRDADVSDRDTSIASLETTISELTEARDAAARRAQSAESRLGDLLPPDQNVTRKLDPGTMSFREALDACGGNYEKARSEYPEAWRASITK